MKNKNLEDIEKSNLANFKDKEALRKEYDTQIDDLRKKINELNLIIDKLKADHNKELESFKNNNSKVSNLYIRIIYKIL